MAGPTYLTTYYPNYSVIATGTNISAGNNDITLNYNGVNLRLGFSITTGTMTAMDTKIYIDNGDGNLIDMTEQFTGVAVLASNSGYIIDIPAPVCSVVIRSAQTNATNAINMAIFASKR